MKNSNSSGLLGLFQQPSWLLTAIVGFVALLIGWFGLAYLFPTFEWVDADPSYLRRSVQKDYVRLTAATYASELDANKAAQRIASLGPNWSQLVDEVIAESQGPEQARVSQLKQVLDALSASNQMPAPAAGPGSSGGLGSLLLPLMGCLLVAALLGGVGFLLMRSRGGSLPSLSMGGRQAVSETSMPTMVDMDGSVAEARGGVAAGSPAIARFMSTYTLGDDAYDDSFSVDGPDGNFLGECGMGISETIGVGDPKKVTAFEVWLFDKNDIRTVTKVIMSEHAFNDEALKSRLAAKGEPVVARPGDTISLETATLVVDARIVDMAYGGGALPQSSFFERLTVELQARRKPQAA